MPRATMTDLIRRLRPMTTDTVAPYRFSDDQLQEALDLNRFHVDVLPLRHGTLNPVTGYASTFYAPTGFENWESDTVLMDSAGVTVVPASASYVDGMWTLAAPRSPVLYVTGRSYDLYAAAITVLEWTLGVLAEQPSFKEENRSFDMGEKSENVVRLIKLYQTRCRPRYAVTHGTDPY